MLYAQRGNLYLINGNMDRAADDLSKAYSMDSRNPVATLGFAKLHFTKNNFTSAKEFIQSTKELDPEGTL